MMVNVYDLYWCSEKTLNYKTSFFAQKAYMHQLLQYRKSEIHGRMQNDRGGQVVQWVLDNSVINLSAR